MHGEEKDKEMCFQDIGRLTLCHLWDTVPGPEALTPRGNCLNLLSRAASYSPGCRLVPLSSFWQPAQGCSSVLAVAVGNAAKPRATHSGRRWGGRGVRELQVCALSPQLPPSLFPASPLFVKQP